MREQLTKLEAELKKLQEQVSKILDGQYPDQMPSIADEVADIVKNLDDATDLLKELDDFVDLIDELPRPAKNRIHSSIKQVLVILGVVAAAVTAIAVAYDAGAAQVSDLNARIDSLSSQLSASQNQNAQLEGQIDDLQVQVRRLSDQNAQLTKQHEQDSASIASLEQRIQELEVIDNFYDELYAEYLRIHTQLEAAHPLARHWTDAHAFFEPGSSVYYATDTQPNLWHTSGWPLPSGEMRQLSVSFNSVTSVASSYLSPVVFGKYTDGNKTVSQALRVGVIDGGTYLSVEQAGIYSRAYLNVPALIPKRGE